MKEVIKKCEEKMTKTCENLDGEFANIRAGRANPNLLNRIMVEYYGTPTPMQQVGNISYLLHRSWSSIIFNHNSV